MVLAICLIIMLILAILGSSAIKTTIVQERATGLTRNKQISFDSSEAALRFGEINADTISIGAATDGSVGLWLPDPTSPRWLDGAIKSSWITLPGGTISNVLEQPQYVMEFTGSIPRDDSCALDAEASANQDCWRYTYRVTAEGKGLNNDTLTTVQSTILSRK
tara:strand:+ start:71 stop:559 length:489 start_codon:yes stop_codon:yes gene_type:complete